MINKATINRWLCKPHNELNFRWRLDFGSKALGSNWEKKVPVTGLLLAGLHSGKVKIFGEYEPNLLVGGFILYIEKCGDITPEDFDDLPITRNELEKIYYPKISSPRVI